MTSNKTFTRLTAVANKNLRLVHVAQVQVEAGQAKVATRVRDGVNALISASKVEGLTGETIVAAVYDLFIVPLVARGAIGQGSANNYKTGLRMAVTLDRAWFQALYDNADAKAAYEAHRASKGGGTGRGRRAEVKASHKPTGTVSVKADKKAGTVSIQPPKSADLEAMAEALAWVSAEPGRIALFLDWVRVTRK